MFKWFNLPSAQKTFFMLYHKSHNVLVARGE